MSDFYPDDGSVIVEETDLSGTDGPLSSQRLLPFREQARCLVPALLVQTVLWSSADGGFPGWTTSFELESLADGKLLARATVSGEVTSYIATRWKIVWRHVEPAGDLFRRLRLRYCTQLLVDDVVTGDPTFYPELIGGEEELDDLPDYDDEDPETWPGSDLVASTVEGGADETVSEVRLGLLWPTEALAGWLAGAGGVTGVATVRRAAGCIPGGAMPLGRLLRARWREGFASLPL